MRLAIFSLLLLVGPVRAADEEKAFYPSKVGTTWTYGVVGQKRKIVVSVTKEDKVNGTPCFVVETKASGKIVASETITFKKGGIYRVKYNNMAIEPEVCFFKAAAKKGDFWELDFSIGDEEASGSYKVDIEDVDVPFGKYKGCRVVRAEATQNSATVKATLYYAKDVGIVKQVFDIGGKKLTAQLEKFETPSK